MDRYFECPYCRTVVSMSQLEDHPIDDIMIEELRKQFKTEVISAATLKRRSRLFSISGWIALVLALILGVSTFTLSVIGLLSGPKINYGFVWMVVLVVIGTISWSVGSYFENKEEQLFDNYLQQKFSQKGAIE